MGNKLFDNLVERYGKLTLTRDELSNELSLSKQEMNDFLEKGICLPSYMKLGDEPNAIILFPLTHVATFIALVGETKKVSVYRL